MTGNGSNVGDCTPSPHHIRTLISHDTVHEVDFRTSEKDFDSFAGCLTEQIIDKDETIPELPVKDIVRLSVIPEICSGQQLG